MTSWTHADLSQLLSSVPSTIHIPDPFMEATLADSVELFGRKRRKSSWRRVIDWNNDQSDETSEDSVTSKMSDWDELSSIRKRSRNNRKKRRSPTTKKIKPTRRLQFHLPSLFTVLAKPLRTKRLRI